MDAKKKGGQVSEVPNGGATTQKPMSVSMCVGPVSFTLGRGDYGSSSSSSHNNSSHNSVGSSSFILGQWPVRPITSAMVGRRLAKEPRGDFFLFPCTVTL